MPSTFIEGTPEELGYNLGGDKLGRPLADGLRGPALSVAGLWHSLALLPSRVYPISMCLRLVAKCREVTKVRREFTTVNQLRRRVYRASEVEQISLDKHEPSRKKPKVDEWRAKFPSPITSPGHSPIRN